MSHIRRSSDPKLYKKEVTIHLHDTSFSPSHGLREDLCCDGSRRINPGLDLNTFVSGMTTSVILLNDDVDDSNVTVLILKDDSFISNIWFANCNILGCSTNQLQI